MGDPGTSFFCDASASAWRRVLENRRRGLHRTPRREDSGGSRSRAQIGGRFRLAVDVFQNVGERHYPTMYRHVRVDLEMAVGDVVRVHLLPPIEFPPDV